MKITSLKTAVVQGNFDWVFVRIETDDGLRKAGFRRLLAHRSRQRRSMARTVLVASSKRRATCRPYPRRCRPDSLDLLPLLAKLEKLGKSKDGKFNVIDLWRDGKTENYSAAELSNFTYMVQKDKSPGGGIGLIKIEPVH